MKKNALAGQTILGFAVITLSLFGVLALHNLPGKHAKSIAEAVEQHLSDE